MLTYKSPWQASRPKLQIIFDIPFLLECSEAIVSSITIPDMNSFEWHPNHSFQKCQECFLFKSDRTKKSLFPSSEHRSVLFNPPPPLTSPSTLHLIWHLAQHWCRAPINSYWFISISSHKKLVLPLRCISKSKCDTSCIILPKIIASMCPHLFYPFNVTSM